MIVPIVEGQSEALSVGGLVRRLLYARGIYDVMCAAPFRVKRNLVTKEGEIERAVRQAVRSRSGAAAVLLLLDADDDCAVELAALLQPRMAAETSLETVCVVAVREFEAWFLAAKESLRGERGIRSDAVAPDDPESIRGAKGHLTRDMPGGRSYIEVDDQPALVELFDLDLARQRSPSFDKFAREIERLGGSLTSPDATD